MFKGILKMKNKEDVHYFTVRPTKNHSDQDSVVLANDKQIHQRTE